MLAYCARSPAYFAVSTQSASAHDAKHGGEPRHPPRSDGRADMPCMAKAIRVGDEVQLPSGMRVRVTATANPACPWGAVFLGRHWHVVRELPAGYARGRVQHFFGGRLGPLQLTEADAVVLAEILNSVRGVD